MHTQSLNHKKSYYLFIREGTPRGGKRAYVKQVVDAGQRDIKELVHLILGIGMSKMCQHACRLETAAGFLFYSFEVTN